MRYSVKKVFLKMRYSVKKVFLKMRCSVKKGVLKNEVFCKKGVLKNEVFCKKGVLKAANLTLTTLLKKRLWHRCFPVKFVKFSRIYFLLNASGGCFWNYLFSTFFSFEILKSHSYLLKMFFVYFNESLLKLMRNAFYFISKTLSVLEKFTFSSTDFLVM